jgi:hypothetical protein
MKQQINEFKRMQLIAGLITESEYRESKMDEAEDNEIYLLDFPEDLKDVAKYKQSGFDVELDDPYNKIYSAKLDLTGMDAVGMQTELLHLVKQKGLHPTLWFKGKSYSADKALELLDKLANEDTYVDSFGTPLDEAEKMDEAEDTLSSFKSLDQMNDYLEKGGWDPYEVADEKAEKKGLMLINKYIKSNILDKGKTLSPNKLNALLMKIEDLLP